MKTLSNVVHVYLRRPWPVQYIYVYEDLDQCDTSVYEDLDQCDTCLSAFEECNVKICLWRPRRMRHGVLRWTRHVHQHSGKLRVHVLFGISAWFWRHLHRWGHLSVSCAYPVSLCCSWAVSVWAYTFDCTLSALVLVSWKRVSITVEFVWLCFVFVVCIVSVCTMC